MLGLWVPSCIRWKYSNSTTGKARAHTQPHLHVHAHMYTHKIKCVFRVTQVSASPACMHAPGWHGFSHRGFSYTLPPDPICWSNVTSLVLVLVHGWISRVRSNQPCLKSSALL